MTTAVVMIVILLVSVMIHELAHYVNARSAGIPVRAFSIGFGPVLLRWNWRGTEWRLSLIPLGGYVDLPGMGPKVADDGTLLPADEGFAKATLPQKLWVLSGGVIANFILGVVLVTSVIMLEPAFRAETSGQTFEMETFIGSVAPGSVAESLGLQAGDVVIRAGGEQAPEADRIPEIVSTYSGELDLVVMRDGSPVELSVDWPPATGERLLGITIGSQAVNAPAVPLGAAFVEALSYSVRAVPMMVSGYIRGFGGVLIGSGSGDIGGPVAIVSAVNQAAQIGLAPVLLLAAIINLSLAVFNLLPIPGLDGGRMLLAIISGIRGRPFRPGQEETIHFFGIMAVLLLIVLVTFSDIGRLLGG